MVKKTKKIKKKIKVDKAKLKREMLKEARELRLKQEKFCELYTTREFFGNGTLSYIQAYNPKHVGNWYQSAMASSSRLLRNVKICEKINELLEEKGMSDVFADKQLLFLMTQHDDFKNKLGAIREYNRLKTRITDKIGLTLKNKLKLDDKQFDQLFGLITRGKKGTDRGKGSKGQTD